MGEGEQTGIQVVPLSCRQRLRKASGGISPARELPMSSPAQLLPAWLNRTSPSGLGPKLPQVHICGKGMFSECLRASSGFDLREVHELTIVSNT